MTPERECRRKKATPKGRQRQRSPEKTAKAARQRACQDEHCGAGRWLQRAHSPTSAVLVRSENRGQKKWTNSHFLSEPSLLRLGEGEGEGGIWQRSGIEGRGKTLR